MKEVLSRVARARYLAIAVLLTASAGSAVITSTILGLTSPESERVQGLLLTSNRDRLAICVQGTKGLETVASGLKSRIEADLSRLSEHPNWEIAGLPDAGETVDIGCPSGPTLLSASNPDPKSGSPVSAETPSVYRLFVFVVPQPDIDRIFAKWPIRAVAQEMSCEGHFCSEVTTAIYLSAAEAADEKFVTEWIVKGIGLERSVPAD